MAARLPFSLKPYRAGQFEKMHACGAKEVSASIVPALFGKSRYATRFSALAHIAGAVPLKQPDNKAVQRGHIFQRPALEMFEADNPGIKTKHVHGFARHPTIKRLFASPDGIFTGDNGTGILEVKTVAPWVYQDHWMAGPPINVHLQVQTQLACTGANEAIIVCMVFKAPAAEIVAHRVQRREDVIETILGQIQADLEMIDQDELPEPDASAVSVNTLLRMHPHVDPTKSVRLDDKESLDHFKRWKQASLEAAAWHARAESEKFWFTIKDPTATLFEIGNVGKVVIKTRRRQAYSVPPGVVRTHRLYIDEEFHHELSQEIDE